MPSLSYNDEKGTCITITKPSISKKDFILLSKLIFTRNIISNGVENVENEGDVENEYDVENEGDVENVDYGEEEQKEYEFIQESRDLEDIPITTLSYNKSHIIHHIQNNLKIKFIGVNIVYHIYFPKISNLFPKIQTRGNFDNDLLEGMSYPVCSCKSYYYNNARQHKGYCKHIYSILIYIGMNISYIDWGKRESLLPIRCKLQGHPEFQWII